MDITRIYFLIVLIFSLQSFAREFSINFMWVYPEANTKEEFLFPVVRQKTVQSSKGVTENWDINVVDDWMTPWFKENPDGHFVFWYDGTTASRSQIGKTNEILQKLSSTHLTKGGDVVLKDVRDLPWVAEHSEAFSSETPTYPKIDLFRVIAAIDYVEQCQQECAFVYVDVDKGLKKLRDGSYASVGLGRFHLFDTHSRKALKEVGLILNQGLENNFFILGNNNKNMINAIKEVVIKSNIAHVPIMKAQIADQKMLMQRRAAHKTDVENVAIDSVNRVYFSMFNVLPLYFDYLEKQIDLEPDPSIHGKPIHEVLSKIDISKMDHVRNFYRVKSKTKRLLLSDSNFPGLNMGGSETMSAAAPTPVKEAIFGSALYQDWEKNYDNTISNDDLIQRVIQNYLVMKGFIDQKSIFTSTIPKNSMKAKKIFFIEDGTKKWAAKLFKFQDEFRKEAFLIDKHREIANEITRLNSKNLPIPHLIQSLDAFMAGGRGVIFMEYAAGETYEDIFLSLATMEDKDIVAIFTAMGRQHASLQNIYALNKDKILYSKDQHSGNVMFDRATMQSYWIDLDLSEIDDLSEVGLVNNIKDENYFEELVADDYLKGFLKLGFHQGLRKYLLAISSLVTGYEQVMIKTLNKVALAYFNYAKSRTDERLRKLLKTAAEQYMQSERNRAVNDAKQTFRDYVQNLFKDVSINQILQRY